MFDKSDLYFIWIILVEKLSFRSLNIKALLGIRTRQVCSVYFYTLYKRTQATLLTFLIPCISVGGCVFPQVWVFISEETKSVWNVNFITLWILIKIDLYDILFSIWDFVIDISY